MSEEIRAKELQDVLLDNGGYITVNKNLIHRIGLNEAIIYQELISKLVYYQNAYSNESNEFYCTQDDLERSTGLSQTAQRTAIKKLKELLLIDYKIKGIPRKTYYYILDTKHKKEPLIYKFIKQGEEIIDLMKQYNEKRNLYNKSKQNEEDILTHDELESELKEIKDKIKNLKI